jgi:NADH-quinone oxidoreductase subunit N
MISLAYYLPVIAAMWMRDAPGLTPRPAASSEGPGGLPAVAGGSSELDEPEARGLTRGPQFEVALVALLAGAGTVVFGIVPQPLFDLVRNTGSALGLL